jgi:phosphatidylserine/phosphatidylglycerophosphate/cardiolipin synthase-like enzyme
VQVRLAYNVDHAKKIPVPPPPHTDIAEIERTGAETKAIAGVPDLMHHKYVIRDGTSVWTGSTNWTEDAWTREENVIVSLDSPELAAAYGRDFTDLWNKGVFNSGRVDTGDITVGNALVRPHFCPGRSRRLTHRVTGAVQRAEKRIRIASPVITSGPTLGALTEVAADKKVDISGVYDGTQMHEVFGQWATNGVSGWKIECFNTMIRNAPFGAKKSTPWAPGAVHDYMHAKVCVCDDVVFLGSYNFSHSGEENAENVLEIKDAALADQLATFIDAVHARYRASASSG